MLTSPKLFLGSCVGQKQPSPTRAKDLYTSPWFRLARAYVEATGCPWFILSAKYGLVHPDQLIEPYERTLNRMPIEERRAWAGRVGAELDRLLGVQEVIFLAGARYREFLSDHLRNGGIRVEVPMEGLTIGLQLQWLSNHIP